MKLEKEAVKKRKELSEIVKSTITTPVSNPEELSERIIDYFCDITPPEIDTSIQLITMQPGGSEGGRSSKPGNIWLDWKKLLTVGAESILTIVGAVSVPWLIPLAGLVVWNKVWSLLDIEIDERHAVVIWAMWNNRDEEDCIEDDKILDLVNEELHRYNRFMMNKKELNNILKDLGEMECIEKTDKNEWWLREWVKATYE